MKRTQLISGLKSVHGVQYDNELMDILQNIGLVADTAVSLDDVPDSDLTRAYIKSHPQDDSENF